MNSTTGERPRLSPLFTWRSAIAEASLASTTKVVAFALSLHMSERGDSCFPSMPRLAAEAGVDESTARRHVKLLIDQGWLSMLARGGGRSRTNRYAAKIPVKFPRHSYFEGNGGRAPGFDEETPAEGPGFDETPAESTETPAEGPINPGTVPGEDVSSASIERGGVRQNELEGEAGEPEPSASIPKAASVEEWKKKLVELWPAMWKATKKGEPARFILPRGLTVDAYGTHPRRVVIFRVRDPTSETPLSNQAKNWDREANVFFTEAIEKGGKEKRGEWKFSAAYGYPSLFHCAFVRR